MKLNRRKLLGGGAAAGLAALLGSRATDPMVAGAHNHADKDYAARVHGGAAGSTFATGKQVDHEANGFNPTRMLRDYDWGKTTRLPNGRVLREWEVVSSDKELEIAPGVFYDAWVFNGTVPGPSIRAREGDLMRIRFVNGSEHPHTMHFHGIHTAEMDGVPGIGAGMIMPGESTVYEFNAEPFGLHLYHCHVGPLAEHIARGMYGAFIVDPKEGREEADELMMMMNGFNTNYDADGNQIYAVNTIGFHYMNEPIRVKRNELVRIYLINILEYDPINSFHVHANFFHYYPTGTSLTPTEYTDTIAQVQGQRGILEMRFPHTGFYMFHAHKTEFAELGWMGNFEVVD